MFNTSTAGDRSIHMMRRSISLHLWTDCLINIILTYYSTRDRLNSSTDRSISSNIWKFILTWDRPIHENRSTGLCYISPKLDPNTHLSSKIQYIWFQTSKHTNVHANTIYIPKCILIVLKCELKKLIKRIKNKRSIIHL